MTSIYDLDDVERMHWALHALEDAAKLCHDPTLAYEAWMELTICSMITKNPPHWSVYRHIAWAARRVCWEIHAGL